MPKPQPKPICAVEGHSIGSIRVNPVMHPATQQHPACLVEQFIQLCTKCGQTLDEIRHPFVQVQPVKDFAAADVAPGKIISKEETIAATRE